MRLIAKAIRISELCTRYSRYASLIFWGHSVYLSNVFGFCRAMLCICAAYAVVRSVRLSIFLSVTFVTNKNKDILKILSPSGNHTILVFPPVLNVMAIFRRGPPNGSAEWPP